jgi:hypothetical protein
MFYLRRQSAILCGLAVHGDEEFQRRTGEALALLEPLAQFGLIHAHLAAIRQGKRSGITAWADQPVFTVGTATWNHSPQWYAGAVAHDAYHVKLYRDAGQQDPARKPLAPAWSGKSAERACLSFQREVLLELNADKTIIAYIEQQRRNPTYQGRSKGLGCWLDYHKRWW